MNVALILEAEYWNIYNFDTDELIRGATTLWQAERICKEKNYNPVKLDDGEVCIMKISAAKKFMDQCMTTLVGNGFHPDTRFEDYIKADNSPSFNENQAEDYNRNLDAAHKAFQVENACIYEYCILNPSNK